MYLLDANVFIEAKNRYFAFDICPGFWTWLIERHQAGTVFSVDAVRVEIMRGNDELVPWARGLPREFFLSPDSATAPFLAELSLWANDPAQRFTLNAIDTFLRSADYQLVAQAGQRKLTVVTHERPDPFALKRIVIPAACARLAVNYISPFELMRREQLRLVLET